MLSFTEENYLKNIFYLSRNTEEGINTNHIAEKMQTKASSVTDMLKKLANKELVNYEKYQGARLSEKGRKEALRVIRKHRIWECFLVEKLDFKWDEVHEIAEQLEHVNSPELIQRLYEFIGNPTHDPHGDPIPDKEGNIQMHKDVTLQDIKTGDKCVFIGVKDSSAPFLRYLDEKNIELGKKIKVITKIEFDQSMVIKTNKKEFSISNQVAKNLFVKKQK